jgi:hypothetical protein
VGEREGNVEGSYPNCETEQAGCGMITRMALWKHIHIFRGLCHGTRDP